MCGCVYVCCFSVWLCVCVCVCACVRVCPMCVGGVPNLGDPMFSFPVPQFRALWKNTGPVTVNMYWRFTVGADEVMVSLAGSLGGTPLTGAEETTGSVGGGRSDGPERKTHAAVCVCVCDRQAQIVCVCVCVCVGGVEV